MKNKNFITSALVAVTLLLSACGGGGGDDAPASPTVGTASVVVKSVARGADAATDVLIDAQCQALGGIAIYNGIDTNKNGELDVTERVGNPQVVCNGGTIASFTANELIAGNSNCPAGGIELIAGTQTTYLCNKDVSVSTDFTKTSTVSGSINLATVFRGAPSRVSSNMQGGLWFTPAKINAAVQADIKQLAANATKPIPTPMIKPIKVAIEADDTYEIPDVPSGEYSLIYIDGSSHEGVKIDDIYVAPDTTVTQDITQTTPNASVALKVASLQLGSNIENAEVRLNELDKTINTSADGTAEFTDLPEGTYSITVSKNGYVSKYMAFTVISGTPTDLQTIELNSEKGSLKGKVTANVVDDLANIVVYAKAANGSLFSTLTDSNGSYTFPALPVGEGYSVLAKAHDFEGAKVSNVTIVSAQEASVSDIVLTKYQTELNLGSVVGFARFEDVQNQLNHAGIVVSIEGTDFEAITSRDGSFILNNLEQGNYIINFSHATHLTQTLSVRVIVGATSEMDDVNMLARSGSLIGNIEVPASFGDTQDVKLSVQDLNGNIVKESFVSGSGSFVINNIVIGENYILRLNGQDLLGNSIVSKTITGISISASNVTTISENLTVEYVDPNPPVITAITYDENTSVNAYGALIVNPSIYETDSTGNKILVDPVYLNFIVVASDADADSIEYSYTVDAGQIVYQNKNQIKWLAPEDGKDVTLVVSAKSNARTVSQTVNIAVNHAPNITLTSPNVINMKDDENILTQTSLDIFTFIATVNDFEDGDLSGNSIEWYSNIQGVIGQGNSLQTTLKPGKHIIVIKATDSQGLVTTSQDYFVQVNTPNEIMLKVPGTNIDYENRSLSSQYDLAIVADELTLNYSSSDTSVAAVDTYGIITSVSTGAVEINVVSNELNTLGEPSYTTTLVTRVIDDSNSSVVTSMNINSIYQVRVDSSTVSEPFTFNNLKKGHYTVVLFDKINVVANSGVISKVTKDGVAVTSSQSSYDTYAIHTFEVSVEGDSYSLYIQPTQSTHDASLKVAFYPGADVRDTNGYINKTYHNKQFEPNESAYMSKTIGLQNIVSSTFNKDDNIDYYSIDVVDGQEYTVEFSNDAVSPYDVSLSLLDTAENPISVVTAGGNILSYMNRSKGTAASYTFTATVTGEILLKVEPTSSNYDDQYYKYWFRVLPSTTNGLVQDSTTFEPNNTPSTVYAQTVALQTKLESELTTDPLDSVDYFNVDLVQGQEYTMEFNNDALSRYDLHLSLLDTTGNPISVVTADGNILSYMNRSKGTATSYTFIASMTGKALIKVEPSISSDNDQYYKYWFRILPSTTNGLVQDSTTFEPNNTPSTVYAQTIALQTKLESELTTDPLDSVDYFTVDIVQGEEYTIEFSNHALSAYYLYLVLHDETGTPISVMTSSGLIENKISLSVGKTSSYTFTATMTGKALIKVDPFNSSYDDKYFKYWFRILPSTTNGLVQDSTTFEPNNTPSTAYSIESRVESALKENALDEYDYYTIELEKDKEYTLRLGMITTTNRGVSLRMNYVDGSSVAFFDDNNNESSPGGQYRFSELVYTFKPSTTGTALIKVSAVFSHLKYYFEIR